jgi:hypothetical protein
MDALRIVNRTIATAAIAIFIFMLTCIAVGVWDDITAVNRLVSVILIVLTSAALSIAREKL